MAFVFALVLGVPTLKLRGDYLAIVTISAAEILRYARGRLEKLFNFTGAAQGIPGRQYRGPFSNLSFFPDGPPSVTFKYTDVANGNYDPGSADRLAGRDRPDLDGACGSVAARWGSSGAPGHDRTGRAHCSSRSWCVFFLAPSTGTDDWWSPSSPGCWSRSAWCSCSLPAAPGAALRGIREDEDAIRSLGKNVFA